MKEAFEKIRKKVRVLSEQEFCKRRKQEECDKYVDCETCLIDSVISIVSEVEAEYGNGWIDVKDRLPEKDGRYLTCDRKGNIHVFYHHPSYVANGNNMAFGICKNHPQFYQPIAWMELPKPYNRLERK